MPSNSPARIPFTKPALKVPEILELYKKRGMIIEDEKKAAHYLTHISYYRLGPYFRFFQENDKDPNHIYSPGTTFEDGLNLYIFDRELRLLFMDALERIEVAVRSCISNRMALRFGSHWYMDEKRFDPSFNHRDFITKIQEATGLGNPSEQPEFARHYFAKYSTPQLPPVWMVAEVLPLGIWSKLYNKIADGNEKLAIAKMLGESRPVVLATFLHRLTILRNICAHHSLLWCRQFQNCPYGILQDGGATISGTPYVTVYWMAGLVQHFLNVVAPHSHWAARLFQLIASSKNVSLAHMGFRQGWQRNKFWKVGPQPEYFI